MESLTKDVELGPNERVISKDGKPVFILDYKTLKTRPVSKERVTLQSQKNQPKQTLVNAEVVKGDEDYGKNLMDLANQLVSNGEYSNLGQALDAVCREYPAVYAAHSEKIMRR